MDAKKAVEEYFVPRVGARYLQEAARVPGALPGLRWWVNRQPGRCSQCTCTRAPYEIGQ